MSGDVQATKTQIVERLNLKPHNTCNGYFAETFRDTSIILPRSHLPPNCKVDHHISTCIYFLLPSGHLSYFHRTPCAQTFHFYLGDPLTVVELNEKEGTFKLTCIGPDVILHNHQLQHLVPPNVWFGSIPTKDYAVSLDGAVIKAPARDAENHYSLVGCTCAPGFHYEDSELAKRSELVSLFPVFGGALPLTMLIPFVETKRKAGSICTARRS